MAEPTQFDIASAQRIARVVRAVENTPLPTEPLRFRRVLQDSPGKTFRIGTFSGAWPINSPKVVTFKYQAQTPNTVSVTNLFFPVGGTSTRDCAIAKDGTAWHLIDVPMFTATAFLVTGTAVGVIVGSTVTQSRLTDINISASLNTSNCTISISKTAVTAAQIAVASTATAVIVQGAGNVTYLQIRE